MKTDSEVGCIPLRVRLLRFVMIVIAGMLSCIHGIAAIVLYPIGLAVSVSIITGLDMDDDVSMIAGYLVYALLLTGFLATNNKRVINWLTITLIVVTIGNVSGCHYALHELSELGN